jgi:hypothetical protein
MMERRVRSTLARAALLATIWLVAIPVAAAADEPRLGLTPIGQPGTYFDLTLEPGEDRDVAVEAANFGLERTRARTYVADVYSIVNGGFGAELHGEGANGPTTWLSYPTQDITLEPQQALTVPFVVSVPLGTPPGEYITALVIESRDSVSTTGPLALKQINRSAIAVAIDVPGLRRPILTIGNARHKTVGGHSILVFEVENTGNVHLWPAGGFVLRGAGGSRLVARSVVMDALYASTRTTLEAPLEAALQPGAYCAELSLTDAATGAHDATDCLSFFVGPAPSSDGPGSGLDGPGSLPGTNVPLTVAPVSLMILAGMVMLESALLLAGRRRATRQTGPRGPGGPPAKPDTASHRVR